jgi:hypothetical protein
MDKQGKSTQGLTSVRHGTSTGLETFTGPRKHAWNHSITPYDIGWCIESLGQWGNGCWPDEAGYPSHRSDERGVWVTVSEESKTGETIKGKE